MTQATHPPHITSYKCISAARPDQLQSLVEIEIHNGWQPYGSLAATGNDENVMFVQPMVQVAEFYR